MSPQAAQESLLFSDPAAPAGLEPLALHRRRAGLIGRLLHGAGAGAVSYALAIAGNLLLLPLYLRVWPVAVYGEWMALYSAVNYLSNLDFGFTFAAINSATVAYARGDMGAFKRVQGTAWAISVGIACAGTAGVALVSTAFFHVNEWLGLRAIGRGDARIVFFGLALSFLIAIPGRQLIAVYIALGEFPRYQWLSNALAFFSLAATAIALALGAAPRTVAIAIVSAGAVSALFSMLLLYRRDPRLIPRVRDADWRTAKMLAAPTGQVGVAMLATTIALQGPVIVISRALGGPAVALFTTTRTIANVIHSTVLLLRAPLRPELAAASAHPEKHTLRRLFRIEAAIETLTAVSACGVLWSAGAWLIAVWSHRRILADLRLLHCMLALVVLDAFLQALASTGWATNKIHGVSLGQMIAAISSVALSALLVGRFGPAAVPIAAIASMAAILAPLAVGNARNQAGLTSGFVLGRMVLPFASLACLAAVLPLLVPPLLSPLLLASASALVVWRVFLTGSDRRAIGQRVAFQFRPPAARDGGAGAA